MSTYRIIRMYFEGHRKQVLARGLTLEAAQAWCNDPETSSRTCALRTNVQRTKKKGAWFDGYEDNNGRART
jgi:hypothetical protein